MEELKNDFSQDLSDKVVEMMALFKGKSLENFPVQCLTRWIGGTLTDVKRGEINMEVTVTHDMTNPAGFFHGGAQCAMIDDAMGYACATLGYMKQFLSTNLTVDYLGTAGAGDRVSVKAYIYREGKSMMHAVGEIIKDGVVITKAQSNLFISGRPVDFARFASGFSKK